MNHAKVIGWIILFAGIILTGWTLFSSYNIFTGKAAAPEIFGLPESEIETPSSKITGIQNIQAEMEKMVGEQLRGLLPLDALPKILNLTVWAMLAWILIFGGVQISGLGIKLIKSQ